MMSIAVEEIAFGRVFRVLKNMSGVISLDIDGNADKAATKNPERAPRGSAIKGTSGRCIVLGLLTQTPGITSLQMGDAMSSAGKSPKTLHSLLHLMAKEKQIKKWAPKKKGGRPTFTITATGRGYMAKNCAVELE